MEASPDASGLMLPNSIFLSFIFLSKWPLKFQIFLATYFGISVNLIYITAVKTVHIGSYAI